MATNVTKIKYCHWCGNPFEVKSPNQRYCPLNISNCSKEAKRENWRKASEKYRNNYKGILSISQVYKLGSGYLGSKPQGNFEEEYLAIQKEKKRLKLSCTLIGLSFWFQLIFEDFLSVFIRRSIIPVFESYPQLLILAIIVVIALTFGIYHEFGIYNK